MPFRFGKNNMAEPKIITFTSDEEFTDFCVAPYAELERSKTGTLYYVGVYSEAYKKEVDEGTHFQIQDEDSQVYKRKCVSKRVPLKGTDRMVTIQLTVENLVEYYKYD